MRLQNPPANLEVFHLWSQVEPSTKGQSAHLSLYASLSLPVATHFRAKRARNSDPNEQSSTWAPLWSSGQQILSVREDVAPVPVKVSFSGFQLSRDREQRDAVDNSRAA